MTVYHTVTQEMELTCFHINRCPPPAPIEIHCNVSQGVLDALGRKVEDGKVPQPSNATIYALRFSELLCKCGVPTNSEIS